MCVCLSVCLSICLLVCLSVCLYLVSVPSQVLPGLLRPGLCPHSQRAKEQEGMQHRAPVLSGRHPKEEEGSGRDEGKRPTSLPAPWPHPLLSQRRGEDPSKGTKKRYLDFIDILLEARVSLPLPPPSISPPSSLLLLSPPSLSLLLPPPSFLFPPNNCVRPIPQLYGACTSPGRGWAGPH